MSAGSVPSPLSRLRVGRGIVTHDFPLKATAIVIAILFAIANAQTAAPRELTLGFDGRVPIERPDLPAGYVFRGQLGDVAVALRGPEGVVDHVAVTDLRATLDLSGVDIGSTQPHDAKVRVTVTDNRVQVVDVTPPTVSVRFERITARNVPVQAKFANDPPKGTQASTSGITPKEVRVSGPESLVTQVAAVFATVRFGDTTTDITQSAPAMPVDANGNSIDGLQVDPSVVAVAVPLLPIATTKTVPVLWSLKGAVASGYWVSQVVTDPVAVTVRGDQGIIAAVDRVDTSAIDLTGLTATKTFHVPIVLTAGVSLLNPVDASVTVTVVPLSATRPFVIAVQVQGTGTGLIAETEPSSVTVTVVGSAPALAAMSIEQLSATVDASGKTAGTYTADVTVRVPAGITVQSVQPSRVTLTIRAK